MVALTPSRIRKYNDPNYNAQHLKLHSSIILNPNVDQTPHPCISHWMEVSQPHKIAGEVCGFFTWLWVFYRAKHDLPVVLGLRHPWEHAEDPWAVSDHVEGVEELQKEWEEFTVKSTNPGEDDDEEEDEDEDEDEGDEGEGDDDDEDDE
ncbi:hypothetical protein ACHAXS_004061 [Conticribra weissflogii]